MKRQRSPDCVAVPVPLGLRCCQLHAAAASSAGLSLTFAGNAQRSDRPVPASSSSRNATGTPSQRSSVVTPASRTCSRSVATESAREKVSSRWVCSRLLRSAMRRCRALPASWPTTTATSRKKMTVSSCSRSTIASEKRGRVNRKLKARNPSTAEIMAARVPARAALARTAARKINDRLASSSQNSSAQAMVTATRKQPATTQASRQPSGCQRRKW